jgi:hypothetical protein
MDPCNMNGTSLATQAFTASELLITSLEHPHFPIHLPTRLKTLMLLNYLRSNVVNLILAGHQDFLHWLYWLWLRTQAISDIVLFLKIRSLHYTLGPKFRNWSSERNFLELFRNQACIETTYILIKNPWSISKGTWVFEEINRKICIFKDALNSWSIALRQWMPV